MVLGPEGQVDFRQRFPDRADAALAEIAKYNKSKFQLLSSESFYR